MEWKSIFVQNILVAVYFCTLLLVEICKLSLHWFKLFFELGNYALHQQDLAISSPLRFALAGAS